ncbi:hypothetical protein QTN47_12350 [Danxiaibacter flavus]|uniref:Uncharacterized protein n=1 Tax=Danxiaibacter flavus TaxID=3049108 RepID=A0ABV3ZFC6_9BACT|nr:hypothetical protein QNM32_12355 [Chitinophagaceae bacterium DXS]
MLTKEEESFLKYWEGYRQNKRRIFRQFVIGLSMGLTIGVCIIVSVGTGWYERASMVANASFNPNVLIVAILGISLFLAFFYKKYKWEMNEQRYKELMIKKNKENKSL